MKAFKDSEGRLWELRINVAAVRLVRDLLKVDLYKAFGEELKVYNQLVTDLPLLIDVLFVLCRDQAKSAGVTDEDFGRAMGGDSLGEAMDAFTDELLGFFPPRQRPTLQALVMKAREVQTSLSKNVVAVIDGMNASELAAMIGSNPQPFPPPIPTPLPTNSPEPSASIPDLSPCSS